MTCMICGSDRMVEGPAWDRSQTTCMDCGSQFNREVKVEPETSEISVAVSDSGLEMPEGGFNTVAEAQAYLEKLKAAKKSVSTKRVDKVSESDVDPRIVMAVTHYYQREGESWNEVLNTAKGERAVRNYNVLIMVHNHILGHACTKTCRELTSDR